MKIELLKTPVVAEKLRKDYYAFNAQKGISNRKPDQNFLNISTGKLSNIYFSHYETLIDKSLPFINQMDQIDIFTHTDMDGDASGAITFNLVKSQNKKVNNILRFNFKEQDLVRFLDNIPEDNLKRSALITDLSLPYRNLVAILDKYDEVVWIDHHDTSFKTAKDLLNHIEYKNKLTVIIDQTCSATYLAYKVFCDFINSDYKDSINYGLAALLVSDYDSWNTNEYLRFEYGSYLNQYYFSNGIFTPDHEFWNRLFFSKSKSEDCLFEVLSYGKKLFNLEMLKNEILYNAVAKYVYTYNDYKICILNAYGNSNRFPETISAEIKVLLRCSATDNSMSVSIFSEDEKVQSINIGKICREYFNGGGHAGAGGFGLNITAFVSAVDNMKIDCRYTSTIEGSETTMSAVAKEIGDRLALLLFHELNK